MAKNPIPSLSGVKVEIPEERYRADLELHDRFQSFSAELLKLSFAGLAATGVSLAFLTNSHCDLISNNLVSGRLKYLAAVCLLGFGLSSILALVHRFFASDGMYHHIRAIKLLIIVENEPAREFAEGIKKKAGEDEIVRNKKYSISADALRWSAVALVVGASALGGAFLSIFP